MGSEVIFLISFVSPSIMEVHANVDDFLSYNSNHPVLALWFLCITLWLLMQQTVELKVGMSCQGCVGAVKRVLGKMEGLSILISKTYIHYAFFSCFAALKIPRLPKIPPLEHSLPLVFVESI